MIRCCSEQATCTRDHGSSTTSFTAADACLAALPVRRICRCARDRAGMGCGSDTPKPYDHARMVAHGDSMFRRRLPSPAAPVLGRVTVAPRMLTKSQKSNLISCNNTFCHSIPCSSPSVHIKDSSSFFKKSWFISKFDPAECHLPPTPRRR